MMVNAVDREVARVSLPEKMIAAHKTGEREMIRQADAGEKVLREVGQPIERLLGRECHMFK